MCDLSTRCHRDQVVLQQIIQQLNSDVARFVENTKKKTYTIWIHQTTHNIHRYLISH